MSGISTKLLCSCRILKSDYICTDYQNSVTDALQFLFWCSFSVVQQQSMVFFGTSHTFFRNGTRILFYVLLTVHLDIIFVNNQLDLQLFFHVCLFLFSTCFGQPRAHHQENQSYQYDIQYMSLCIDDRVVCTFGWDCNVIQTRTAHGHLYGVTYTGCRIDTIDSPDDGHVTAQNMWG
jgi:hypothetical protein